MLKNKSLKEISLLVGEHTNKILLDFVKTSIMKNERDALCLCVENEFNRISEINSQFVKKYSINIFEDIFDIITKVYEFETDKYTIQLIFLREKSLGFIITSTEYDTHFTFEINTEGE